MSDPRGPLDLTAASSDGDSPLDILAGLPIEHAAPGVLSLGATQESLFDVVQRLAALTDARLADMFAVSREESLRLVLVYALDRNGQYLVITAPIVGQRYPELSKVEPAAFLEESEIYEAYGIRPAGGLPLDRVLLSPAHPEHFPMHRKHARRTEVEEVRAPHVVEGEAFEFPFGPVRAVAAESLYFGLVTTGEEILDLYIGQWHKHRAIESRLVGLEPERACFLVERTEGLSAVGNTLAFVRAVETVAEAAVPEPALCTRAIALELERIYNHAAALAALCQSTGLSVGQARMEILLERCLRLNAAASGHRYLFGVIAPGGVRRELARHAIASEIPSICREMREVTNALLSTNSHVDRLEATGVVGAEAARRLGIVGPIARASARDIDTRRDHMTAPYERVHPSVALESNGDVLSRMNVMVAEVAESERLVVELLDGAGPGRVALSPGPGWGIGWAESPRGETLVFVETQEDGRITRARVRPAAVRNWRVFDDAARSRNVFTDIPIIEASFWLTVAGFAR